MRTLRQFIQQTDELGHPFFQEDYNSEEEREGEKDHSLQYYVDEINRREVSLPANIIAVARAWYQRSKEIYSHICRKLCFDLLYLLR